MSGAYPLLLFSAPFVHLPRLCVFLATIPEQRKDTCLSCWLLWAFALLRLRVWRGQFLGKSAHVLAPGRFAALPPANSSPLSFMGAESSKPRAAPTAPPPPPPSPLPTTSTAVALFWDVENVGVSRDAPSVVIPAVLGVARALGPLHEAHAVSNMVTTHLDVIRAFEGYGFSVTQTNPDPESVRGPLVPAHGSSPSPFLSPAFAHAMCDAISPLPSPPERHCDHD